MMKYVIFLVLVGFCWSVSLDKRPRQGRIQNKPVPCVPEKLMNLEDCCDTPKLLPMETAQYCANNIPESKTGYEKAVCLVECILKRHNWYVDGIFKVASMVRDMTQSPSSTWKPIIKVAVESCEAFHKQNTSAVAKDECDPQPGILITCVGRELTLKCPTSSRKSYSKTCEEQLQHLRECTPIRNEEAETKQVIQTRKQSSKKAKKPDKGESRKPQ